MKVGILGAGAIGCTIGSRIALGARELHDPAVSVTLVGRPWAIERMRVGVTLSRFGEGERAVPPSLLTASTSIEALSGCDVVFVATKSKDTREAARELRGALSPKTIVGSLQNGVRSAEILAEELPGREIWPAMVPFNVVWIEETRLHQGTSGPVVLPEQASRVVRLLQAGGAHAVTHSDVRGVQWGKLLLNLNNAINALSGLPLKEMLSNRDYRLILADVIDEGRGVLRAAGIRARGTGRIRPGLVPLALRLPDWLFFRAASAMIQIDPLARSSMADDLARGRPTEVDDLNGEIVALAARLGAQAPLNAALVRLVHEAERAPVALSPGALRQAMR